MKNSIKYFLLASLFSPQGFAQEASFQAELKCYDALLNFAPTDGNNRADGNLALVNELAPGPKIDNGMMNVPTFGGNTVKMKKAIYVYNEAGAFRCELPKEPNDVTNNQSKNPDGSYTISYRSRYYINMTLGSLRNSPKQKISLAKTQKNPKEYSPFLVNLESKERAALGKPYTDVTCAESTDASTRYYIHAELKRRIESTKGYKASLDRFGRPDGSNVWQKPDMSGLKKALDLCAQEVPTLALTVDAVMKEIPEFAGGSSAGPAPDTGSDGAID